MTISKRRLDRASVAGRRSISPCVSKSTKRGHVLPRLEQADESHWIYLQRAVENFYLDQTRKSHPDIAFGGPDEVEVKLIEKTRRLAGRKGKFGGVDEKV